MVFLAIEMFWHLKLNKTHIQNQEKSAKSQTLHKLKIVWKMVSGRLSCLVLMSVKDFIFMWVIYCCLHWTGRASFGAGPPVLCPGEHLLHPDGCRAAGPFLTPLSHPLRVAGWLLGGSAKMSGCNRAGPCQPHSVWTERRQCFRE